MCRKLFFHLKRAIFVFLVIIDFHFGTISVPIDARHFGISVASIIVIIKFDAIPASDSVPTFYLDIISTFPIISSPCGLKGWRKQYGTHCGNDDFFHGTILLGGGTLARSPQWGNGCRLRQKQKQPRRGGAAGQCGGSGVRTGGVARPAAAGGTQRAVIADHASVLALAGHAAMP